MKERKHTASEEERRAETKSIGALSEGESERMTEGCESIAVFSSPERCVCMLCRK